MKIFYGEVTKGPYTIFDSQKDVDGVKYVDVLIEPDGYVLPRVQCTRTKSMRVFPQVGSIVAVQREDDCARKILQIIADPIENLKDLRGDGTSGDNLKPGEMEISSVGNASVYLDNKGNAKLSDASCTQVFHADVGTMTAHVLGVNVLISDRLLNSVKLDKDGSITVKREGLATIQIDITGKITINSAVNNIEIKSTAGSVNIDGASSVNINSAASVTIKGLLVKIGGVTKKLMTEVAKRVFNYHGHEYLILGVPTPTSTPTGGILPTIIPPLTMDDAGVNGVLTSKTEAE